MSDTRLVLFVDWQNSYKTAREIFYSRSAFHAKGQFDPWALGLRIAGRQVERSPRTLSEVRVYRGVPDPRRDAKGAGAHQRHVASWKRAGGGVVVQQRALRYPRGWPSNKAEEKGVDVQLAVDLVAGYLRRDFDVGVVLSRDTDLVPALELACEIANDVGVIPAEVATWTETAGKGHRLNIKGRYMRCHWLTRDDYEAVKDHTDYNIRRN